ncbi:MAG: phosphoribosylamine--glycine ligase [Candidatus Gastranaerophilales bacterium]|nr:phosphoribosylamine--glycine ligase [Candidatus Gastranaerophilales bacterium]
MKVLVVGSGGKDHALVWSLAQSKKVSQIFCAPGNAGIKNLAECIDIRIDNIEDLCRFAKENNIDLTIVGAKLPLSMGIVDLFKKNNLLIFGPTQAATKIETSKSFTKKLLNKYHIPTAPYAIFDKELLAIEYARKAKYPLVIKYDGTFTRQSVFICETFEEAKRIIENCFENLYKAVVIEEFLTGKEVSFHVITDGYNAVPLSTAQNYKKAFDGNAGPNTEGMGSFAPVSFVDTSLEEKIAQNIIFPLIDAMTKEGISFTGILHTNLLIDEKNNPYLLGVNSSIGDPEAQVILPLLEDDLFDIMYSAAIGAFADEYESFNLSDSYAISVVLTSAGYPNPGKKGTPIEGLEFIDDDDVLVFHSGTVKNKYAELITNDGRVLSVTAIASTLHRAYDKVYDVIDVIDFKDMRYRKDIAKHHIEQIACIL